MIAAWLATLRRQHEWATAMLRERLPAVRPIGIVLCVLSAFVVCATAQKNPTTVQTEKRWIVIGASMLLDGRGHVLRDSRIVVEGSKIVALDPKASPVDYDLRGMTVMPGWIDSHVHITWSFGENGKNAGRRVPSGVQCLADADGRLHDRAERRLAQGCSAAGRDCERSASGSAHP